MHPIGPDILNELKNDLERLKRAYKWPEIGLVLFNHDGSYAHKVLHGVFPPSVKALRRYLVWRALNRGGRTVASPELCQAVWDYLPEGKEYCVTSLDMAKYFLIDRRKIRKACAKLIERGYKITDPEGNVIDEAGPRPVGSCTAGYYRIVKPSEKAETERQLQSREREIRKRRINLRKIHLPDPHVRGVMVAKGVAQLQLP